MSACLKTRSDRMGFDGFVLKAQKIHGDRYIYHPDNFETVKGKALIECKIHGPFFQNAWNHLNGKNCPPCSGKKCTNQVSFLERCKEEHGDRYDYSNFIYRGVANKGIIICRSHGEFLQSPGNHLSGKNCPKCSKVGKINLLEFIDKANIIHHNKYDYSKSIYIKGSAQIEIICPYHGPFWQRASSHINNKHGCQSCGRVTSKLEVEWLDYVGIPSNSKHRQVPIKIGDKNYRVDGYLPDTKDVFEFNGDYFHGNPKFYASKDINNLNHKFFGELYEATLNKAKCLTDAGYIVHSIWASDFIVQKCK